jgi:hypothetical protein
MQAIQDRQSWSGESDGVADFDSIIEVNINSYRRQARRRVQIDCTDARSPRTRGVVDHDGITDPYSSTGQLAGDHQEISGLQSV